MKLEEFSAEVGPYDVDQEDYEVVVRDARWEIYRVHDVYWDHQEKQVVITY